MERPACGSDLNPVGHLWDHALRARVTNTTSLADLRLILVEFIACLHSLLSPAAVVNGNLPTSLIF